jgi:hypothetical protein
VNLKPNEEIQVSALSAAVVYGIFQVNAPNLADVRASRPGNAHVHGSVKTAAWTATAVTAGLALLAKSPTIFIVGGVMTVIESWKYFHANTIAPATGVPSGMAPDSAGS